MPAEPDTSIQSDQPFRVGEWLVEPMLDQVTRGSEVYRLEPRTMRVLVRLAQSPGKVVSSEELLDSAWSGVIVSPASVYQAISQLRKLLGDIEPAPRYIATVPRRGYRLVAPVSLPAAEPVAAPSSPAATREPAVDARAPIPMSARRLRWPWIAGAVALIVATAVSTLLRHEPQPPSPFAINSQLPPARWTNALAILPFEPEPNEPDKFLVPALRLMLFDRFSAIPALPVIGTESSLAFAAHGFEVRDAGRVLHARFLLRGRAARSADQLHMVAELYDTSSGAKLWSQNFDRPTAELTAVREEITQGVIGTLGIDGTTRVAVSRRPIHLDAYELYAEGHSLIGADSPLADIDKAASIFSRVTALDPAFARGYVGVGQALTYHSEFQPSINGSPDVIANALQAYDRAIELDPGLGVAWMQRANIVGDPKLAEQLFRKGLELEPNYMVGSMFFAWFLTNQGRVGEASEILSRALEFDPYSATLHIIAGDTVMAARSDTEQALKLYRTAAEIYPDYVFGLGQNRAARVRVARPGCQCDPGARPAEIAQVEQAWPSLDVSRRG